MRALTTTRPRALAVLASALLLLALGFALLPGRSATLSAAAVALAAFGGGGALAQSVPGAVRMLVRRRSLLLVVALAGLVIAWVIVGISTAEKAWPPWVRIADGTFAGPYYSPDHYLRSAWPWRIGRLPLPPLLLALLGGGGGFVLLADAVRVQMGLARPPRSVWRSITATPSRTGRTAVRAVPGVALIAVAASLAVSLVDRYVAADPVLSALGMLAVGGCAAILVASPVVVGLALRLDVDKAGRAREQERRRFAAHLHDSVLQTLALIQRQATDPETVTKLARRQEHALRAWMAGEADLSAATLAASVREMVAEVEDEHGMTVEVTAIGDRRLDGGSEELIAAAREALRNAGRHAPGAPVNVFLDIGTAGTEMFIHDDGPGFDFDTVPPERRGLRDAVIGRMSVAGGTAVVESRSGEGTEVVLRLPHNGRGR